jgi:hypothetical protein
MHAVLDTQHGKAEALDMARTNHAMAALSSVNVVLHHKTYGWSMGRTRTTLLLTSSGV